ncbi:hypothetical protein HDR58_04200 [bacterium]|nr:hypothetical protein [bacterium]
MKVVGIEKVHYMSKKSNQWVDGLNLHCISDPVETEMISGQTVERLFISNRSAAIVAAQQVKIGDDIKAFYNRFGSIDDIMNLSSNSKK